MALFLRNSATIIFVLHATRIILLVFVSKVNTETNFLLDGVDHKHNKTNHLPSSERTSSNAAGVSFRVWFMNADDEQMLKARISVNMTWRPEDEARNTNHYYSNDVDIPDLIFEDMYGFLERVTSKENVRYIRTTHGEFVSKARFVFQSYCRVDFLRYPFETKVCRWKIYSTSRNHSGTLSWVGEDPVKVEKDLSFAHYYYIPIYRSQGNCDTEDDIKTHASCLVLEFRLKREISFFVNNVFVPSTLGIAVIWLSTFLEPGASSRAFLLGTCFLIITLVGLSDVSKSPVSYLTAIDRWLSMCQIFVLLAILEFVAVNRIATKHELKQRKNVDANKTRQDLEDNEGEHEEDSSEKVTRYFPKGHWHIIIDVLFRINYLFAFIVCAIRYYFTFVKIPHVDDSSEHYFK